MLTADRLLPYQMRTDYKATNFCRSKLFLTRNHKVYFVKNGQCNLSTTTSVFKLWTRHWNNAMEICIKVKVIFTSPLNSFRNKIFFLFIAFFHVNEGFWLKRKVGNLINFLWGWGERKQLSLNFSYNIKRINFSFLKIVLQLIQFIK